MSSLSDVMNKVSRLVTPELRAEDERKRHEAEIAACNDFLKQKTDLETQLTRANQKVEKLAAVATQASQQLDTVDVAALKAACERVTAAARTIERYVGTIAAPTTETRLFEKFLNGVAWDFMRTAMHLRIDFDSTILGRTYKFSSLTSESFNDVEKGLAHWSARIAELRQTLVAGLDPASREGQKLFFKDEVVGHKTERRAGYPFVFLTEKVQVPVTKRIEFTGDQKAAIVKTYTDAIDVMQSDVPALLAQIKSIAQAVAKVEAYEDAKRSAQGAQAQLEKIPADLVDKVQCHAAALNKGGLVIKGR